MPRNELSVERGPFSSLKEEALQMAMGTLAGLVINTYLATVFSDNDFLP